jgi:chromosome partitioning protein
LIIAVAHSKGGVGKSTIAFNLAVSLPKKYNVELVDMDFQKTTTYANAFRKKTGLAPLPLRTFDDTDNLKDYIRSDSDEKVSVIDVGGFDSSLNRLIILTADIVVTPVSASGRELLGLKRFGSILDEMSDKIKKNISVNVLLNNISPQKSKLEKLQDYISNSEHFNLLDTILRRRVDYDYSMDEGKGVIEYDKNSKASAEMKELTKEIKNKIERIKDGQE